MGSFSLDFLKPAALVEVGEEGCDSVPEIYRSKKEEYLSSSSSIENMLCLAERE